FIYKGKIYKTCSNCLDKRSKAKSAKKRSFLTNDDQLEKVIEVIYEEVSFDKIIKNYVTSKTTDLVKDDELSFNLY
ncbi:12405_t:CDS:1, partial [Cetraspora pellucida]